MQVGGIPGVSTRDPESTPQDPQETHFPGSKVGGFRGAGWGNSGGGIRNSGVVTKVGGVPPESGIRTPRVGGTSSELWGVPLKLGGGLGEFGGRKLDFLGSEFGNPRKLQLTPSGPSGTPPDRWN